MKFIDLFAGIGGFRMALENLGGQCVLSAEWNKYARETYAFNFKIDHPYETDVAKLANTPENKSINFISQKEFFVFSVCS